jgi:hypothetical protein
MALAPGQLCRIFAAVVLTAIAFVLSTSAYAENGSGREVVDFSARSRSYLGSHAWDPGGGDFRWNYGPGISWYWAFNNWNCRPQRQAVLNRRGHRVATWVYVCN